MNHYEKYQTQYNMGQITFEQFMERVNEDEGKYLNQQQLIEESIAMVEGRSLLLPTVDHLDALVSLLRQTAVLPKQ